MNKFTLLLTATLFAPVIEMENDIVWMAVLSVILVMSDLFFGIKKAIRNGDDIRTSRAIRRSVDKLFSYLCWILLSCVFGITFGEKFDIPALPYIIFGIVCIIELNSIYANYLEYRGINKKINIFRLFRQYDSIVEDTEEPKEKKEKEWQK